MEKTLENKYYLTIDMLKYNNKDHSWSIKIVK